MQDHVRHGIQVDGVNHAVSVDVASLHVEGERERAALKDVVRDGVQVDGIDGLVVVDVARKVVVNRQRALDIVRASSSLPYVSKMVEVDGIPMLDGGIVDSIPVLHAIEQGHPTNVVVQTRNYGYRSSEKDHKIPPIVYKEYPRLRVALSHRCEVYNRQLEMVEQMEGQGKIVCIRPQRPMEVDRIERDLSKLERLYEEGFEQGEAFVARYWK